jgi:hypothetical protein
MRPEGDTPGGGTAQGTQSGRSGEEVPLGREAHGAEEGVGVGVVGPGVEDDLVAAGLTRQRAGRLEQRPGVALPAVRGVRRDLVDGEPAARGREGVGRAVAERAERVGAGRIAREEDGDAGVRQRVGEVGADGGGVGRGEEGLG